MANNDATESWNFMKQVVEGRWFSVFTSFMIMIGAGSTYLFGAYSKVLKTQFDYDQTQVNTLGFAKDLGSNFGVLAGLLAEVAPMWVLFLVGSSLNFFSYFMMWLSVTRRIANPQLWQMFIYICLATNSQNFANTAVLVTSLRNFPDRRGVILGLLKGFVGIGGAILTQMYLAFYGHENPADVILLLSWFPSVISLVFMLSIRTIKVRNQPHELRVFYHFLYVSIILALYILFLTLTQKHAVFSRAGYVSGASVIVCLLCLPLLIAIREEFMIFKLKKQHGDASVTMLIRDHKAPSNTALEDVTDISQPRLISMKMKPERGDNFTAAQALLSKDMALIVVATLFGCGSSIAAIDNIGQIAESLHFPSKSIAIFVSWVSIFNFFGRVFSGFISETLMVKYKLPRPLMLTFSFLLTCIGQLLIAYPSPASVYVASLIIGFGFGAQVPLVFAIISELFGLKHYSTLFNCGQLAVPLGSYILNVDVVGKLYDMEAIRQGSKKTGQGLTCTGARCFGESFIILVVVTMIGAITSLVLAYRTRDFYKGDTYKKCKEDIWIPQTDMEFYCLDNRKTTGDK